ncbi:MAG TPA: TIGR00730 family Rossman fold protein, partial [Thermoanaerobaculia bacterium]|nr:TIGR00730 family Rossman fold protein [Thermoanaerobaculia bacterium]
MPRMRICVFCGANSGANPSYASAAKSFGSLLASRGIGIVYGGGSVGLMGALADAALTAGGEVTGVIPRALWEREVGHRALTQIHIVETMHERKAMMSQLSDAFVALPGGLGTLEEIFEVWTWGQLGLHRKPCGFLNVNDYFSPLIAFIDRGVESGFVRPQHRAMAIVESDPDRLLAGFESWTPSDVPKW